MAIWIRFGKYSRRGLKKVENKKKAIQLLLEAGADPNAGNRKGRTPLSIVKVSKSSESKAVA